VDGDNPVFLSFLMVLPLGLTLFKVLNVALEDCFCDPFPTGGSA
jgi:hypothetical protein